MSVYPVRGPGWTARVAEFEVVRNYFTKSGEEIVEPPPPGPTRLERLGIWWHGLVWRPWRKCRQLDYALRCEQHKHEHVVAAYERHARQVREERDEALIEVERMRDALKVRDDPAAIPGKRFR